MKNLLCYAEGRAGDWEAICVDLDISVQGQSFNEVSDLLNQSICDYLEDAILEDEKTKARLLNRRAPFSVRMSYLLKFLKAAWFSRNTGEQHSYSVPCPA